MSERHVKQVIVWRKDLKVRAGKRMAQAAHASMAPIFNMMYDESGPVDCCFSIYCEDEDPFVIWKNGKFTKIVVSVDNEEQLLQLFERIKTERQYIPIALITDAGLTEFNNVPTNTCLGIGPWWSDEIDEFTKDLPLF